MVSWMRIAGFGVLLTPGLIISDPIFAEGSNPGQPTELVLQAAIPRSGFDLGFGFNSLWMMSGGGLIRIDTDNNAIAEIDIPGDDAAALVPDIARYRGIAVGEGAIWLPDLANSTIYKVDPQTNKVTLSIQTDIFGSGGSIGVGAGSVWVITFEDHDKTLTRYSAHDGAMEAKIALPRPGKCVLADSGSVWVTASRAGELYRIDPKSNQIAATIAIQEAPTVIAAANESIWIPFETDGSVQRIDSVTNQVIARVPTGAMDMESDGDITAGGGYIWTITRSSLIAQIDPETDSLVALFRAKAGTVVGRRIRYGSGSLWISGSSIFRFEAPR